MQVVHPSAARRWLVASLLALFACSKAPPEPAPTREPSKPGPSAAPAPSYGPGTYVPRHPIHLRSGVEPSPDDPIKGEWGLDDAIQDFPPAGPLTATIDTDLGKLDCRLYDDKAPITVANFVGLARGLRPWKDPSGQWVRKPAYDGTVFHRIIKGFVIQAGDPKGDGSGDPGYVIPDEPWQGATHDRAGLLCMANHGPNTGGAQFFITDGKAVRLDKKRSYTIFGECGPVDLVHKIAAVDVDGERPKHPPEIKSVKIQRGP